LQRIKQQEQSFTNCFVKNLPPSFTEERMGDVVRMHSAPSCCRFSAPGEVCSLLYSFRSNSRRCLTFVQFGQFGKISRLTVRKNDDGTLKGFGFVEFESHEAAAKAVAEMDGKVLEEGHPLHIERALTKPERMSKLKSEKNDTQARRMIFLLFLQQSVA
jgi:RNA recognition motif-containing protein